MTALMGILPELRRLLSLLLIDNLSKAEYDIFSLYL